MKYLIVGLGNIGPEYQDTRHNIGFNVLDAFAKASNVVFEDRRYGAVSEVKLKGRPLILLKPNTYMNLSGKAVSYWMQKEKIALEDLLILVDDLALPFGTLRLRGQGSDGGHNGLKSIINHAGTQKFKRVRVGVGANEGNLVNHVLGKFSKGERVLAEQGIKDAVSAVEVMILEDINTAMNKFN